MAREDGYLSGKESRRISKENRKITAALEKKRKRKNVPESEYLTEMKNPENTVEFENLRTYFYTDAGTVKSVDSVSFSVPMGKTVGVVGESGCGKSVTSLSLMQLLQRPQGQIVDGAIRLNTGDKVYDISKTPETVMQHLRGNFMSMIFQEPMTSLNPVMKSGLQIREGILVHNPNMSKQEADQKALDMIKLVGIPAPEKVFSSYPHELSGGMRQRVMIAMALACQPSLLICDEPTTALDVTVQAQILQIIDRMKQDLGTAVMLITHDMGVVSEMADWVLVMYAGHRVEYAQSAELFTNPLHPYAQGLIASIPSFDEHTKELYAIPGSVPMLSHMPSGCPFHPRCPFAKDICKNRRPGLTAVGEDNCHTVSCWKYTDEWGE